MELGSEVLQMQDTEVVDEQQAQNDTAMETEQHENASNPAQPSQVIILNYSC